MPQKFCSVFYDIDKSFLEDMEAQQGQGNPDAITVTVPTTFSATLEDKGVNILAVFMNPDIGLPAVIELVKKTQFKRPGIPVIFVSDFPPDVPPEKVQKIGVSAWKVKPVTYSELYETVKGSRGKKYETDEKTVETVTKDRATNDKVGHKKQTGLSQKEMEEVAEEYSYESIKLDGVTFIKVSILNFINGNSSAFDLYIRVSNKMVKVLNKNEVGINAIMHGHVKKGVKHYYIKVEDHLNFIHSCESFLTAICKDPKIGIDSKLPKTVIYGSSVINYMREANLDKESYRAAENFAQAASSEILLAARNEDLLQKFIANAAAQEHAVSHSMIAGILINSLGGQEDMIKQIALACYLHDVSLLQHPDLAGEPDPESLSEEQKEIYLNHPNKSAEIVSKMGVSNRNVLEAIRGHHMRLNGKGFPKKDGAGKINRIAEVIGIADEFLGLIKKAESQKSFEPMSKMRDDVFPLFSKPVKEAFETAFVSLV